MSDAWSDSDSDIEKININDHIYEEWEEKDKEEKPFHIETKKNTNKEEHPKKNIYKFEINEKNKFIPIITKNDIIIRYHIVDSNNEYIIYFDEYKINIPLDLKPKYQWDITTKFKLSEIKKGKKVKISKDTMYWYTRNAGKRFSLISLHQIFKGKRVYSNIPVTNPNSVLQFGVDIVFYGDFYLPNKSEYFEKLKDALKYNKELPKPYIKYKVEQIGTGNVKS